MVNESEVVHPATSFPGTPIIVRNSPHILDAENIYPFSNQDAPQVISYTDGPRRHAPISHLETSSMGAADLGSDRVKLIVGYLRAPDVAHDMLEVARRIVRIGLAVDCGIGWNTI